jgi:hypothetical protein
MIFTPVTILWPNINLEKVYNFRAVLSDTLEWNVTIVGLNLTNWAIRGECYDLNVSNRMANVEGGAQSAPEIVVTFASDEYSCFTAVIGQGGTSGMQPYAQIEFQLTSPIGQQTTIMQQPIAFSFERILWQNEAQNLNAEGDGEDPLF